MTDTLEPQAPPSVEALLEGALSFRDLLAAGAGTDWSRLDGAGVADAVELVEGAGPDAARRGRRRAGPRDE